LRVGVLVFAFVGLLLFASFNDADLRTRDAFVSDVRLPI
jgi:hypothetical protein